MSTWFMVCGLLLLIMGSVSLGGFLEREQGFWKGFWGTIIIYVFVGLVWLIIGLIFGQFSIEIIEINNG